MKLRHRPGDKPAINGAGMRQCEPRIGHAHGIAVFKSENHVDVYFPIAISAVGIAVGMRRDSLFDLL
mgnify:CR=1 FL=1